MDSKHAQRATREVAIISGTHCGAAFTIASEDLLVIGADETCDIRLSDVGLAPRHAALTVQSGGVTIRQLDGRVSVNGRMLGAADRSPLPSAAEITLGDSGVRLRLMQPLQAQPPTANSGGTQISRPAGKTRALHAPGSHARRWKTIQLLRTHIIPATLMAIVVAGIATQRLHASRSDAAAKSSAAIAASLATPVEPPLNGAELVEQVEAVFRTNGYEAVVTDLGGGRVRVENLDESNARVRKAAALVRADVRLLKSLSFAAQRNAKPAEPLQRYAQGPGARMRAVVDEDTAYLATEDGSRYFVGSVLPTGDTVRRISSDGVQVDQDGRLTWLKF
jgi:type III secretion protein D